MDSRPHDTVSIINTRSRIRLCSFLSIIFTFIYISIQENLTGVHISYLHTFHMFIQPLILLAAVLDFSSFPATLSLVHLVMFFVDAFVTAMSAISVSRCFSEVTATCAERIYEKGILVTIGGCLSILDFIVIIQLRILDSQLIKKDIHEKAEEERLKTTGDVPTWNSILINKNKIKIINIFLIPFDITYAFCVWHMTSHTPLFYLTMFHILINPFMLYFQLGFNSNQYIMFRFVYLMLLAGNVLMMVIQLQILNHEISTMVALLIGIIYIITDLNQIIHLSQCIETIEKYNTYKRSL